MTEQGYNSWKGENEMDTVSIIFRALELLPRFIPQKKPPQIDFTPLEAAMPRYEALKATEIQVKTNPGDGMQLTAEKPVVLTREVSPSPEDVATACLSCSRSHLSAVSGALGESLRFARESGIAHPEVQRRIMLAEDEINIMERIDLAPDALQAAPEEVRNVALEYLPRIRTLRQDLGNIASVDQLEKTAADASLLGQEFRLRHLQLRGVDLNPVLELAKKVQAGEMTMEDAKAKLKDILPDEE